MDISLAGVTGGGLDEELQCPVCLEMYRDPVSLPCQHIFCRQCLHIITRGPIADQSVLRLCPVCRTSVEIKSADIDGMPQNFTIANIISKFRNLENTKTDFVSQGNDFDIECKKHKKTMTVFCDTCDCALCTKCLAHHSGHTITDVEDKVKSCKEEVEQSVFPKMTRLQESFTEARKDLRSQQNQLEEQISDDWQEVKDSFRNLRSTLDKRELELSSNLQKRKEKILLCFRKDMEDVDVHLDSVKQLRDRALTVVNGAPVLSVKDFKVCKDICDDAANIKLPSLRRRFLNNMVIPKQKLIMDTLTRMATEVNNMMLGFAPQTAKTQASSTLSHKANTFSSTPSASQSVSSTPSTSQSEPRKPSASQSVPSCRPSKARSFKSSSGFLPRKASSPSRFSKPSASQSDPSRPSASQSEPSRSSASPSKGWSFNKSSSGLGFLPRKASSSPSRFSRPSASQSVSNKASASQSEPSTPTGSQLMPSKPSASPSNGWSGGKPSLGLGFLPVPRKLTTTTRHHNNVGVPAASSVAIASLDQQPAMKDMKVIWAGHLGWEQKVKPGGLTQPKISRTLRCQFSIAQTDPDINSTNWPEDLIMKPIPTSIFNSPQLSPLYKNSRKVTVHMIHSEKDNIRETVRVMVKLLTLGFTGFVQFPATSQYTIRMLLIVYSHKRKTFIGLIPNDQAAFVTSFRNVVSAHNKLKANVSPAQKDENKPGPSTQK